MIIDYLRPQSLFQLLFWPSLGRGGDSGVGLCAGEVGSRYKEHNALCFSPGPIYYPVSGKVSVLIFVWSFGE